MKEYYKEYVENNGKYPDNENKKWETKEQLSNRVMSVIDKYKKMLKTKGFVNKKEIYERIGKYRGYYLECLDIANLLEARYKGVM